MYIVSDARRRCFGIILLEISQSPPHTHTRTTPTTLLYSRTTIRLFCPPHELLKALRKVIGTGNAHTHAQRCCAKEGYLVPFTSDFSINWRISCNSASVNVTSLPEQFSSVRSACLGAYDQSNESHSGGTVPYEDPGSGITCGPSELTQPMQSCVVVIFFLLAISVKASTMVKLSLKFWLGYLSNRTIPNANRNLRLLGTGESDGANHPLHRVQP